MRKPLIRVLVGLAAWPIAAFAAEDSWRCDPSPDGSGWVCAGEGELPPPSVRRRAPVRAEPEAGAAAAGAVDDAVPAGDGAVIVAVEEPAPEPEPDQHHG